MRNSKRVKAACQKALAKLAQLTPGEVQSLLAERELGPVGSLLVETGTIQHFVMFNKSAKLYWTGQVMTADTSSAQVDHTPYVSGKKDEIWLLAA